MTSELRKLQGLRITHASRRSRVTRVGRNSRLSGIARAILLYRSIKLFDSLTTDRSELSPLRSVSADAVGLGTFLDAMPGSFIKLNSVHPRTGCARGTSN